VETRFAPALVGGRYRVVGVLGEGGMARVFDAVDEQLERPVAVKILRAETQSIPGMRQRFQQEAFIAARLIHPNIVAVFDFGAEGATSYLVMERLPGSTLRDEIVARGPLPPSRVALVMAETLSGLSAAHRFGVLHRDVKPSNILLQGDGHTKITDFGIAKSFDTRHDPDWMTDERTVTGFVLGTPGYLAPERRSGCPATVQSDLYAVGAVMVEALTGQRLGSGPAPCAQLAPPLRDVARRATATNPRDRFTSAREMLQALQRGMGPSAPAVRARTTVVPAVPAVPAAPAVPAVPATGVAATATMATAAGSTLDRAATLTALRTPAGSPSRPRTPVHSGTRRRTVVAAVAVIAALALAGAAVILLPSGRQPSRAAVPRARHDTSQPHTQALTRTTVTTATTVTAVDAEGTAIRSLALSLATVGLPGDGALATVLEATAMQAPAARQSSAEQALTLAQVLLDGGGISARQYQAVVNILQATGATVTTTTTAPSTPGPALPGPLFQDHGHGHGHGDDQGSNG
jgi:serine/threonine-protein kinase